MLHIFICNIFSIFFIFNLKITLPPVVIPLFHQTYFHLNIICLANVINYANHRYSDESFSLKCYFNENLRKMQLNYKAKVLTDVTHISHNCD